MASTMLLTPPRAAEALSRRRATIRRAVRALVVVVVSTRVVFGYCPARAEELARASAPLAPDALDGGRYVGLARRSSTPSLRVAGNLGYGFTESVLNVGDRHHRVAGELAAALVLAPWLQFALGGELRMDRHSPGGPGRETGWLGSSFIATRHVLGLGPRFAMAAAPKLIFPGADRPRRGVRAASYELALIATARALTQLELSLLAGYRIDRTRHAVADARQLAPAQRLAAALSEGDAFLLGALVTVPLSSLQATLEWSWELARRGRVHALESPMRVRLALQRLIAQRYLPSVELGVDVSRRPELIGLTRIEPRLFIRLGLAVVLERVRLAQPAVRVKPGPVAAQRTRRVSLRVLDAVGRPVVGARVAVPDAEAPSDYTTDAAGQVTLQLPVSPTASAVTISAPGFDPLERALGPSAREDAVTLLATTPLAEIKGFVRSLSGEPVLARVTVLEEGVSVSSDTRGQFALPVAPGSYTLQITSEGYESQQRRAQVEAHGVTIIVIDLRSAPK